MLLVAGAVGILLLMGTMTDDVHRVMFAVLGAALGFLWLGTVGLTGGLVGYIFGPRHMSMLWGIVFFGHQLGSFFGGWGAGRLYDIQGNYDLMWWIAVGLGVFAAVIHWRIPERPIVRPAMAPAPA